MTQQKYNLNVNRPPKPGMFRSWGHALILIVPIVTVWVVLLWIILR